jgi:hypothetical protein
MRTTTRNGTALAALACAGVLAGAAEPANVPYPAGYRDWAHVKSMVIEKGHPLFETFGGIHHIYANAPAMRGYGAGKFPDGSVIVFDLLEATEGGNTVTEGKRKVLGVMRKDAKRFKDTGGWGFEGFAEGDRARPVVAANAATACFKCHADKKESDFVFSAWRD